ncbi:MAG: acyltransferase family protein [Candidatus Hodarchaeota archaeon]
MTNRNQTTKLITIEREEEVVASGRENFFQIDILKAAMIFLVIFDHIVSWNIKSYIGVSLWERISIPVFLVIMGFNMGRSFQRQEVQTLKELYSWSYFKNKIIRYILPFLTLYIASTFIGLFMYGFDLTAMWWGQYYPEHGFMQLFIGYLLFWGPGNWFLPVLFQSILIMPLLYFLFKKKPIFALVLCFVVEIAFQLGIFFFIGDITSWEEVHILNLIMNSVLFYLPGIALGLWFSFGYNLNEDRNFFVWLLYPISLAFIVAHQFFSYRIRIDGIPLLRGDYHFLIIPYSAFLFLLAMKFLPQKSDWRISRGISLISRSTYHILLTQILGYGMITAFWGTHYVIDTLVTLPLDLNEIFLLIEYALNLIVLGVLFVSFGILWYKIDQNKNILRRILYYFNFFIVFSSLFFLSFWAQTPSIPIPIPLIIIIAYAIAALITYVIIRRPLKTKVLGFWTLFLAITFTMMVLEISLIPANFYWFSWIPISISLAGAVIITVLDYISKKIN